MSRAVNFELIRNLTQSSAENAGVQIADAVKKLARVHGFDFKQASAIADAMIEVRQAAVHSTLECVKDVLKDML
jgi:hypothetical protein